TRVETVPLEDAPAASVPLSTPAPIGSRVRYHATILVIASAVLAASFLLEIPDPESVAFFGVPVPGTCTLRRFTGYPCAGCGLTRSFVALAHGRVADSLRFHPVGIVLFGLMLAQFPLRAAQIHRIRTGRPEWDLSALSKFWWVLIVAMVVQWLWRLAF